MNRARGAQAPGARSSRSGSAAPRRRGEIGEPHQGPAAGPRLVGRPARSGTRTLEALRAGETVTAPARGAPGRLTARRPAHDRLPGRFDPRSRPPGRRVGRVRTDLRYARTQRGRATSSTCWNTTRTGSPIAIVAGSISLIAPVGRREQVADEADRRVLLERHDDHVVGRELLVRREQRRVRHDERPDRPAARRRLPRRARATGSTGTSAAAACADGRTRARLHEQLAARGAGPERRRVLVVEIGEQEAGSAITSPSSSPAAAPRSSARPRRS